MQSRKDSKDPRINLDNARVSKVDGITEKSVEENDFKGKGKSNNRRRGKKGKGKSQSKSDSSSSSETKTPGGNDIAWYSKNINLVNAAGRIPFATIAGSKRPDGQGTPGIMALQYIPNYTMGSDANAMSQAFESQLSFVVHANSRTTKYDAVDLGVMELAGMEVFSILAHVVRAYGVAKYYAEETRYTAGPLLTMMGFRPADFRNNLNMIFFDINLMINLTKNIWVPNTMPLLSRMLWLNSFIYQDAEGARAQYYMFTKQYYYMYTEKLSDSYIGSTLKAAWYTDSDGTRKLFAPGRVDKGQYSTENISGSYNTYTWAQWKEVINNMIEALLNDSDRGTIYGDLLKAYGAERIFAMPEMPLDYKVVPVYKPVVLTQIENATIMKGQDIIAYMQKDGEFLEPVYYVGTSATVPTIPVKAVGPINPVLNFHMASDPTPVDVFEATRFTVGGADIKAGSHPVSINKNAFVGDGTIASGALVNSKPYAVPRFVGSEIITSINVGLYNYNNNVSGGTDPKFEIQEFSYSYGSSLTNSHAVWAALMAPFDWSPMLYIVKGIEFTNYNNNNYLTFGTFGESTNALSPSVVGELDNYTFMNTQEMRNLHSVAIFSLLDIPIL